MGVVFDGGSSSHLSSTLKKNFIKYLPNIRLVNFNEIFNKLKTNKKQIKIEKSLKIFFLFGFRLIKEIF